MRLRSVSVASSVSATSTLIGPGRFVSRTVGMNAGGVVVRAGSGPRAFLEVEDTGPGIPPAERERVFDRFYRGEATAGSGSGLGLAIVRRIAQRHGGEVRLLDAKGPAGLRVRVDFPATRP